MPLSGPQKVRIGKYFDKADRGGEPVFVGRADLFEVVARNARAAANGDVEGRTVCLAGPPGVGKTAFLRALGERAPGGGWGGPPMACIEIPPAHLRSPARVLAAIAWQLPKDWRPPTEALLEPLRNISGAGVSVGAAGFNFSATLDRQTLESPLMPWEELPTALKRLPPGAVLCLSVDEAHTLPNTLGEDRNLLLQSVHMGPPPMRRGVPPPVFAVLAGHTQTPEVLEPSISQRYATGNLRYLGSLSHDESVSYVLGTLRHLQGSGRDPHRNALAQWVAGECGGFPHHLRNALESVAEGMLHADSLQLADLDGAFVADDLRKRRELYYEARAKGAVATISRQLGALLRGWSLGRGPDGREQGEVALDSFLRELPPETQGLLAAKGVTNGVALMEEMIRRGVLMHDRAGGGCRCPIDSLIRWLEMGSHVGRAPFPDLAGGRREGAAPSS